jgi:hypothetical protein
LAGRGIGHDPENILLQNPIFIDKGIQMKQSLLVAALVALAVTACGKKEEPVAAAPAPAAAPAAAPAPAADAKPAEAAAPAAAPAADAKPAEAAAPAAAPAGDKK